MQRDTPQTVLSKTFVTLGLVAAVLVISARVWIVGTTEAGAIVGYFTTALAIALQRVITSFAGYLIILRGKAFTVGDRTMISGVLGDLVALGYMQTTVMEMGQTLGALGDDHGAVWRRLRFGRADNARHGAAPHR